ncbi:acyltransferase [Salmonella enterica subsp. enterica serovar Millesi]|nr:acyltransferase [Salmonella enterica subsp. enterica serovar Millesi]EBW7629565.1 acyltransferase [Salmonella enterica subsp. enterica serovar Millesi]EBZ5873849.1 acyltransferase [Salmonella enterica subsp. enterica serovar Millesi]ECA5754220.1 acyltransferase [Salmonella enterica subsp. enterica serovar Millesi]ECA9831120.1 acyltransferase [Salmonella enterica subsp. enterica serovar Millesi]
MSHIRMNTKIYSIQALRGIAALMVALGHLNVFLNGVYSQSNLGDLLFFNGAIGVDIFFVISGFIIALATEKKESFVCVKFIIKRFFRLYPVYLFSFLVFSLVVTHIFLLGKESIPLWFNFDNIVKSLFFLQLRPDDNAPFYGYSLIITAWTLSYEIYFYLIFCIAMAISHKYRAIISAIAIVAISLIIQKIYTGHFTIDAYAVPGINGRESLTIAANPISFDFILGLIAFYIFKASKNVQYGIGVKALASVGFVFGVLCWNSGFMFGHGLSKFGGIAFIFFMSVVFGELAFKFKIPKSLVFLGDISYSVYIIHIVVIFAYREFGKFIPFIPQQNGFSLFVFLVSVSILLSYAMYRFIEKPSIKLSHAICKKM